MLSWMTTLAMTTAAVLTSWATWTVLAQSVGDAPVNMNSLLMAVLTIVVCVLGFFLRNHVRKVEKNLDELPKIQTQLALLNQKQERYDLLDQRVTALEFARRGLTNEA